MQIEGFTCQFNFLQFIIKGLPCHFKPLLWQANNSHYYICHNISLRLLQSIIIVENRKLGYYNTYHFLDRNICHVYKTLLNFQLNCFIYWNVLRFVMKRPQMIQV